MSICRALTIGGIICLSALVPTTAPASQRGGQAALTERDREELRFLSARYSFALGTCDDKTWPELFVAPNGYFASGSRGQVLGRHRLAEMIRSYNCNYVNGVAPPHAPGVVIPYKTEFSATAGGAQGVLPYNGGEYHDTYVKTAEGWRFASRTVVTNKELAASLAAADFAEIQRLAAEKVGPFEDVYEDTPVGRRFKSAGVVIEPGPGGAKGTAYVKDGGQYRDTYTKTAQGWRIASREFVRK
jgi:hypothetical protein